MKALRNEAELPAEDTHSLPGCQLEHQRLVVSPAGTLGRLSDFLLQSNSSLRAVLVTESQ